MIAEMPRSQVFGSAQAFTACFAAYSHGAGDVSNEVAPFAAIWATYQAHHIPDAKHPVAIWVYAYCGAASTRVCGSNPSDAQARAMSCCSCVRCAADRQSPSASPCGGGA